MGWSGFGIGQSVVRAIIIMIIIIIRVSLCIIELKLFNVYMKVTSGLISRVNAMLCIAFEFTLRGWLSPSAGVCNGARAACDGTFALLRYRLLRVSLQCAEANSVRRPEEPF